MSIQIDNISAATTLGGSHEVKKPPVIKNEPAPVKDRVTITEENAVPAKAFTRPFASEGSPKTELTDQSAQITENHVNETETIFCSTNPKTIPIIEENSAPAPQDTPKVQEQDDSHLVPGSKAKLIHVKSTVRNMKKVGYAIRSDHNVLLTGDTGAGKTALVKYMAHLTKSKLCRINLSNNTDEAELIGDWKPDPKTGRPVWVDGMLTKALRKGYWVLLDEVNLAPPELTAKLHSVLEDDRYLLLERKNNEVVKAHPKFRLFATRNPGDMAGRETMNKATLNRYKEIWVESLTPQEMKEIVKIKSDLPEKTLLQMAMVHQTVADLANHDKLGRKTGPYAFTLRDMLRWTKRINHFQKKQPDMPVEKIIWREARDIYEDRFPEPKDRKVVEDTLELVFGSAAKPSETADKKIVKSGNKVKIGCVELEVNPQGGPFVPNEKAELVAVESTANMMEKLAKGAKFDEPMLIMGETAAGKTAKVKYLARLTNNNLVRYNLGMQTDTFDFIGGYKPTNKPGEYKWTDGVLIDAMRKGYWVLMDEINAAYPAILERINGLLDGGGEMVLTEKDNEVVKAHPNFRVFATGNPPNSKYTGINELSRAMRNRFNETYDPGLKGDDELVTITGIFNKKIDDGKNVAKKMVKFHSQINKLIDEHKLARKKAREEGIGYTIRDLKAWSGFMKEFTGDFGPDKAFTEGAEYIYAAAFPQEKDRDMVGELAKKTWNEPAN